MTAHLDALWHLLLGFVFYYPLFMSFLWMIGAALFYWRFERADTALDRPRPIPGHAAGERPHPLLQRG